ncbi:MAG: DNA-processing protein DprA [Anaerolineales bacterium]
MGDKQYWVAFNITHGIGPAKLRALIHHFGDLGAAWRAGEAALRECGLDRRAIRSVLAAREQVDLARVMGQLEAAGVQVLTWDDADYPTRLRNVLDAPPVLYVHGGLEPADEWAVAIVGTRNASVYGREVTHTLAHALGRAGVTIVSGLARGIDRVAHVAALEAGGRTIAVLGSGVDRVYPAEHKQLAKAIRESGAVVSDYALGTPPEARNFPPRNRIISGLSLAVVIVEAGERSGALITAEYAADQGREVFAVPGSILSKRSRGTNRLIRDGVRPVLSAEDILEELNMQLVAEHKVARAELPANRTEAAIMEHLGAEPLHVDELTVLTSLPVSEVSSTLALLELKGRVRQVGGMHYVLAREERASYVVE